MIQWHALLFCFFLPLAAFSDDLERDVELTLSLGSRIVDAKIKGLSKAVKSAHKAGRLLNFKPNVKGLEGYEQVNEDGLDDLKYAMNKFAEYEFLHPGSITSLNGFQKDDIHRLSLLGYPTAVMITTAWAMKDIFADPKKIEKVASGLHERMKLASGNWTKRDAVLNTWAFEVGSATERLALIDREHSVFIFSVVVAAADERDHLPESERFYRGFQLLTRMAQIRVMVQHRFNMNLREQFTEYLSAHPPDTTAAITQKITLQELFFGLVTINEAYAKKVEALVVRGPF